MDNKIQNTVTYEKLVQRPDFIRGFNEVARGLPYDTLECRMQITYERGRLAALDAKTRGVKIKKMPYELKKNEIDFMIEIFAHAIRNGVCL